MAHPGWGLERARQWFPHHSLGHRRGPRVLWKDCCVSFLMPDTLQRAALLLKSFLLDVWVPVQNAESEPLRSGRNHLLLKDVLTWGA